MLGTYHIIIHGVRKNKYRNTLHFFSYNMCNKFKSFNFCPGCYYLKTAYITMRGISETTNFINSNISELSFGKWKDLERLKCLRCSIIFKHGVYRVHDDIVFCIGNILWVYTNATDFYDCILWHRGHLFSIDKNKKYTSILYKIIMKKKNRPWLLSLTSSVRGDGCRLIKMLRKKK